MSNNSNNIGKSSATVGIGFGACLAMVVSGVRWGSVLWAAIHGLMGWVYVIYYIIRYGWTI